MIVKKRMGLVGGVIPEDAPPKPAPEPKLTPKPKAKPSYGKKRKLSKRRKAK
jgi:hypothetical protein